MKRPLSIVLAEAFDRAAHDVFVAPQVHDAYDEPEPTAWDNWVYWSQGFVAGLVGDCTSMPLSERFVNWLRRQTSTMVPSVAPILPSTRAAREQDR